MADTPKHSVSVAGVVVDDRGRVLVVRRRDNARWEPPGGVLELDETPQQGARREIFEETGVDVEVLRLSGVYKNMERGVVALVFRCRPVAGSAQPTNESAATVWLDPEHVAHEMEPAYAVRVADAFDSAVDVRSHDGHHVLY